MISKEAAQKFATLIDRGFIDKCAEYGFSWNKPEDKKVIMDLMNIANEQVNNGGIRI